MNILCLCNSRPLGMWSDYIMKRTEDGKIQRGTNGLKYMTDGWSKQENIKSLFWQSLVLGMIYMGTLPSFHNSLSFLVNLSFVVQNQSIQWINSCITAVWRAWNLKYLIWENIKKGHNKLNLTIKRILNDILTS